MDVEGVNAAVNVKDLNAQNEPVMATAADKGKKQIDEELIVAA